MPAGLTQAGKQARQQSNSQPTQSAAAGSFSNNLVTRVSHQQKALQPTQLKASEAPITKLPGPPANKPPMEYPVTLSHFVQKACKQHI